ncbi:MAG: ERF family protein [Acidobacteriota bacterium]|nr:ERF family protein [Acidobacteriota bacterium]
MSTALEPIKPNEVQQADQPTNFLEIISRAARDPSVDVSKMQALLNMRSQIRQEDAKQEFWAAMARLQPKLPRITKEGAILSYDKTVKSRYAKYEDIDAGLRPLLQEEGFSVFYRTSLEDGILSVTAIVAHASGHSEETTVPVPIDVSATNSSGKAIRNAAQDMGSTISYGKRYALCAAFNVVTVSEDDDAQGEGAKPLTDDEFNKIEDWLLHLGGTPAVRKAFEGYLQKRFGSPNIRDLKRRDFDSVISALRNKAEGR